MTSDLPEPSQTLPDEPVPYTCTATFRPHVKGFGFATPTPTDSDAGGAAPQAIFIPPQLTRGLLADDHITVTAVTDDKGPRATHVAVKKRPRRMVVGSVAKRAGRDVLIADPALTTAWVTLDRPLATQLQHSENRIVVALLTEATDELRAFALVAGPFVDGSPDAVRARTVITTFGRVTPADFAGAAIPTLPAGEATTTHLKLTGLLAGGKRGGAAGRDRVGPIPGDVTAFVERRHEPCVTIDGATSRDLDDALHAVWDNQDDSDVQVAVHIVDAARAIGIGSPADLYARVAAATTYFTVGDNAPMIDPTLSEDALSLLPNTDRFVLSVRFAITPNGTITTPTVEAAAIRSRAKLSYGDLDAFMTKDVAPLGTHGDDAIHMLSPVLDALIEGARRLGTTRDTHGLSQLFSEITEEPAIIDGRLTVVTATAFPKAYQVVERLMVAANETVAGWLHERAIPALYRNHQGLDDEKAARVFAAADLHDVPVVTDEASDTSIDLIARFITAALAAPDAATKDLLLQTLAGATARATYSPLAANHVGLNAAVYTHFTSPLRRYADLVVHRQLRAALANENPPYTSTELAELGVWLDARLGVTAQLASAERAALWDLLLARGVATETTTATVTAVTKAGLRLRFSSRGTTGFLPAARLPVDTGEEPVSQLDVDPHELATTNGRYVAGQTLTVTFDGTDTLGRANWRLA